MPADEPSRSAPAANPAGYTFGDNEKAARRLRLLAETFAPSSRDLLERQLQPLADRPILALDLGCGPGLTTWLLHSALRPIQTVGLDASAAFMDQVTADDSAGVSFVRHDVTTIPFPARPAGVLYTRFLLTHLSEPS